MCEYTMEQVKAVLRLDEIPQATFSKLILRQFQHGLSTDAFNVGAVINAIKKIQEGCLINRKGIRQFKNEPLKGFFYVHWFEARFIPQNLLNHWGMNLPGSKKFHDLFHKSMNEKGIKKGEDDVRGGIDNLISNLMDGFSQRSKESRRTGEWIIFHPYSENTAYLSLAQHREGDDNIYAKMVKSCASDYPELFPKEKILKFQERDT